MTQNAEYKANAVAKPVVVLREEFDNWAILFNPETAGALGINPVGVCIWKLLDGRHSPEGIVEEMRRNFDDVPDTVLAEVNGFIGVLKEHNMLE